MDADLEEIKTWKVPALRDFVRLRGLKVTGRKEELAARAFCAIELDLPLEKTKEELALERVTQYADLLKLPGTQVQVKDPKEVKEWLGEKEGMKLWPKVYLSDISTYFMSPEHPGYSASSKNNSEQFITRLLNEYKEGKGYRYFSCDWLQEVLVSEDTGHEDIVFLRALCTPSQHMNNAAHITWVSAHKSGKIQAAYCYPCTAGLGGSCNHAAALLFRVEAAVTRGYTSPACTSLPCTWKIPGKKPVLDPAPLIDMDWKQDRYGKKAGARKMVIPKKKLFTPLRSEETTSSLEKFNAIKAALENTLPKAVWHAAAVRDEEQNQKSVPSPAVPDPPQMFLTDLLKQHGGDPKGLLEAVKQPMTAEDVSMIEEKTVGQSSNERWLKSRLGRITASNFRRVFTRMKSYDKKPETSLTSLLDCFLGTAKDISNLPQIKHGNNLEPEAKQSYCDTMKKTHTGFTARECGLFVDKEKPYLGASPDLVVQCDCCGEGLLEVKCPLSSAHLPPAVGTPSYIVEGPNGPELAKNHAYYTQVQGQLAVTGRKWCDFLVYSKHGMFLRRHTLDIVHWNEVCSSLENFFEKILFPYMVK